MNDQFLSLLQDEQHFSIIEVTDKGNIIIDMSEDFKTEFAKHLGTSEWSLGDFETWISDVIRTYLDNKKVEYEKSD